MSVQSKVLAMLKAKEWVGNDELENAFPKGVEGHFSWSQRLRGLRESKNGGYILIHRVKKGTKHLTEWHLEMPQISQERAILAPKALNKGGNVSKAPNMPQNAKNGHLAQEEAIRANNLSEETKINTQMFEKKGQFSFMGG